MSTQDIFRCKTDNACHIKTLSEVISNILQNSFWEIGKEGIKMSMFDETKKIMVTVDLQCKNFFTYYFGGKEKLFIGMNSTHLHKMMKSVKKKDTIELYISKEDKTILNIKTIPRDKSRTTLSSIKIQSVQNIDIISPMGYDNSVIVNSSDFHKMIRDLHTVGSDDVILSNESGEVKFVCDLDGIMKREVIFGEKNLDICDTNFRSTFNLKNLDRIAKISSLSNYIYIHANSADLPICISTKVGNLGDINIYVKSNEIINYEES